MKKSENPDKKPRVMPIPAPCIICGYQAISRPDMNAHIKMAHEKLYVPNKPKKGQG